MNRAQVEALQNEARERLDNITKKLEETRAALPAAEEAAGDAELLAEGGSEKDRQAAEEASAAVRALREARERLELAQNVAAQKMQRANTLVERVGALEDLAAADAHFVSALEAGQRFAALVAAIEKEADQFAKLMNGAREAANRHVVTARLPEVGWQGWQVGRYMAATLIQALRRCERRTGLRVPNTDFDGGTWPQFLSQLELMVNSHRDTLARVRNEIEQAG